VEPERVDSPEYMMLPLYSFETDQAGTKLSVSGQINSFSRAVCPARKLRGNKKFPHVAVLATSTFKPIGMNDLALEVLQNRL
jgi:predicted nucleic acid-binding Zn ribbon protein